MAGPWLVSVAFAPRPERWTVRSSVRRCDVEARTLEPTSGSGYSRETSLQTGSRAWPARQRCPTQVAPTPKTTCSPSFRTSRSHPLSRSSSNRDRARRQTFPDDRGSRIQDRQRLRRVRRTSSSVPCCAGTRSSGAGTRWGRWQTICEGRCVHGRLGRTVTKTLPLQLHHRTNFDRTATSSGRRSESGPC